MGKGENSKGNRRRGEKGTTALKMPSGSILQLLVVEKFVFDNWLIGGRFLKQYENEDETCLFYCLAYLNLC